MPTKTKATLSIFVANATGEEIVWNVTGYHGEGWSKGSVSWDGRIKSKVNLCFITFFLCVFFNKHRTEVCVTSGILS
jgi:hypothetical protein